ncbi:MAG: transposase [Candidatus Latescibacterota bacterium]
MGVLQTWRRDLAYHPHIHYLVPGGALADDHRTWRPHRYHDWLLPESALAAAFKLRLERELGALGLLEQLDPAVWTCDKKWVVDAMPAGTGETVLQYLPPYVHRIAISNPRLRACRDGKVTFRFKARGHAQWRHMTLPVDRFIARFLQHVLPRGFVKVRYYGFLAAQARTELLPVIRQLLPESPHPAPATAAAQGGPPPRQEPRHDPAPDLAAEAGSDRGPCRPLSPTNPGAPDAGDGSVAPPSPLPPHPTDDVGRPSAERSWHRCPSCGHPLVLFCTLPRLYSTPDRGIPRHDRALHPPSRLPFTPARKFTLPRQGCTFAQRRRAGVLLAPKAAVRPVSSPPLQRPVDPLRQSGDPNPKSPRAPVPRPSSTPVARHYAPCEPLSRWTRFPMVAQAPQLLQRGQGVLDARATGTGSRIMRPRVRPHPWRRWRSCPQSPGAFSRRGTPSNSRQ